MQRALPSSGRRRERPPLLSRRSVRERNSGGAIPLREALPWLCATGFIVAVVQKGFRVADVSLEEIADITETRQESDRLNPEWERAHNRFYQVLIAGCKSEWLTHFASMLCNQTARYGHLSAAAPHAHDRNLAEEHEAIVQAVLSHDVELASSLTCRSARGRSACTSIRRRTARKWSMQWRTGCVARCITRLGCRICFRQKSTFDHSISRRLVPSTGRPRERQGGPRRPV